MERKDKSDHIHNHNVPHEPKDHMQDVHKNYGPNNKKNNEHNHHQHNHNEGHNKHYGHSIADFKKRFWVSLVLTIPISYLSMMVQMLFGYNVNFTGDTLVLFLLSTVIFFYGGKPFLLGAWSELKNRTPAAGVLFSVGIVITPAIGAAVMSLSTIICAINAQLLKIE